MGKLKFSELVNIDALQKMADNLYNASGIPVGICDSEQKVLVEAGWKDICTKYHRKHPVTCKRCEASDQYIKQCLYEEKYIEYKCLNNLWDVALPIIVLGEHIATLFVGQFFYDDEIIDIEYFKRQASEFGFNEEEYISEVKKIPVFTREKVKYIMDYYKGLVITLVESSLSKLHHIESEKKLRRNEARTRNLLQSMRDYIYVMDTKGVFIEQYNAFKSSPLFSPREFIGKRYDELLNEEISKKINNAMTKLKNGETIEPFEYSLEIGDKILWYSSLISKINGEGEEIEGFISVVRDITNKKIYEEELLKAKTEAENANDVKNNFIANMSHELRTPINVILSAVQLFELEQNRNIESKLLNRDIHLKSIKQNCYRLLRIINNIIDITKIDAGFMKLHLKNENIVSLVEDITFSVAEYAKAKEINVQFDTEFEEKIISLDADKIERIFLNLLSNAIKCTSPGGSVFVNIYDEDDSVRISIKDTGIGIPIDKLHSIFDRFVQVEDTLIKSHEGSGIGLSIVKSFVEMHDGTITALSEENVGSEFIIEFPVKNIVNHHYNERKIVENNQDYVQMLNVEFSDIYI